MPAERIRSAEPSLPGVVAWPRTACDAAPGELSPGFVVWPRTVGDAVPGSDQRQLEFPASDN